MASSRRMRETTVVYQRRRSTEARDHTGRQVLDQGNEPIPGSLRITNQGKSGADFAAADNRELTIQSATEQAAKHVLVAITNPARRLSNLSL